MPEIPISVFPTTLTPPEHIYLLGTGNPNTPKCYLKYADQPCIGRANSVSPSGPRRYLSIHSAWPTGNFLRKSLFNSCNPPAPKRPCYSQRDNLPSALMSTAAFDPQFTRRIVFITDIPDQDHLISLEQKAARALHTRHA